MTSEHMPRQLRARVRTRAGNRCEYCRLSREGQLATFHVDHIRPRRDGGPTAYDNLALACPACSLHKAARSSAPDPQTGENAPVFHPRREAWSAHFGLTAGLLVEGHTPTGRATAALLRMNRLRAVLVRREEAERGRFP